MNTVLSQPAGKTRPDFSTEPSFRAIGAPGAIESATSVKVFERLRLLWDERRVIGTTALTGFVLGTILAFLLPKQYQSTAQLMPPETSSSSATMLASLNAKVGSGIGAMAGDFLGGNSTGALFVGVLRSRTLEARLVQRFDLKKQYGQQFEEDACTKLSSNTGISEDHKSGIIAITVVDHDPRRAAALAQAHVEELNRLVSELSTSAAHRERVFLEDRLQAVKHELDQASVEFSQFASKNTAINIPEQGKAMVEAAALLQGQLIAAESELKGLAEIYTANNVRVRSVQARVSELRRQLEKLDGDSASAKTGAGLVERSEYPTMRELPLLGVTYADLLRRTKIEEAVYETLTQQYEMAKVEEAKATPSVKVLDMASLPQKKVFPPRLLIMVWGALMGFAGAALAVAGRNRWQQLDSRNPGKMLACDVFRTVNATMPWSAHHSSHLKAVTHRLWARFVKPHSPNLRDEGMPLN